MCNSCLWHLSNTNPIQIWSNCTCFNQHNFNIFESKRRNSTTAIKLFMVCHVARIVNSSDHQSPKLNLIKPPFVCVSYPFSIDIKFNLFATLLTPLFYNAHYYSMTFTYTDSTLNPIRQIYHSRNLTIVLTHIWYFLENNFISPHIPVHTYSPTSLNHSTQQIVEKLKNILNSY